MADLGKNEIRRIEQRKFVWQDIVSRNKLGYKMKNKGMHVCMPMHTNWHLKVDTPGTGYGTYKCSEFILSDGQGDTVMVLPDYSDTVALMWTGTHLFQPPIRTREDSATTTAYVFWKWLLVMEGHRIATLAEYNTFQMRSLFNDWRESNFGQLLFFDTLNCDEHDRLELKADAYTTAKLND